MEKAAARLREIEAIVNMPFREQLIEWESVYGGSMTGYNDALKISLRGIKSKFNKIIAYQNIPDGSIRAWLEGSKVSLNSALLGSALAALVGAAVAFLVAYATNNAQLVLESQRAEAQLQLENKRIEASRILEIIKNEDPYQIRRNLYWLFETKLVTDDDLVSSIKNWYNTHDAKDGPAFPQHVRPEGVRSEEKVGAPLVIQGSPPTPP